MTDFAKVKKALEERGYGVKIFAGAKEAADYVCGAVADASVGIGGSATVEALGLYERLCERGKVIWHWKQDADVARKEAMNTEVYLTSANALAETGEIVNIDGMGNRVASTLFGHKKVFFIIGKNKLTATYEDAVFRARNVASPARARQLGKKTPCAVKGDRCYDCRGTERICHGMVTLWGPMTGMEAEVVLIDEELGL